MLHTKYYLIKPTEQLKDLLENYKEMSSFLNEPFLWLKEESGNTSLSSSDYKEQVKLIFLIHLKIRLERMTLERSRQLSNELFAASIGSIGTFDKWWTIERLMLGGDFSEVLEDITAEDITPYLPTGNLRLDKWLKDFIELLHQKAQ